MLAVGLHVGAGLFGLAVLLVFFGIPIWAVVSVVRNLRGGLRIAWAGFILLWLFFVPLISLVVSVMWFVFKSRFVDYQRAKLP